jgi:hypothetical protein
MFKRFFTVFGLLVMLLVGCQNPQYQDTSHPTPEPYKFRTSEPGTVTLHGKLIVMDPDNMPASNDAIYLVPLPVDQMVISVPSITFGEVPQADVNERTGEFVFTDLQPGKYIIMVVLINDQQVPARTQDEIMAVVDIKEADRGQTIEIKYLQVP